jgi:signal transduction histidine kinase
MCDDNQFVLRVSDQGRGMSQEQIARIGAFIQFDRNHYAQPGMGLGLALCQLLAQIHQAKMTIESKLQKGTTVTVSFKC